MDLCDASHARPARPSGKMPKAEQALRHGLLHGIKPVFLSIICGDKCMSRIRIPNRPA